MVHGTWHREITRGAGYRGTRRGPPRRRQGTLRGRRSQGPWARGQRRRPRSPACQSASTHCQGPGARGRRIVRRRPWPLAPPMASTPRSPRRVRPLAPGPWPPQQVLPSRRAPLHQLLCRHPPHASSRSGATRGTGCRVQGAGWSRSEALSCSLCRPARRQVMSVPALPPTTSRGPCTLHPAPCTLHPAPCTLHPAPC